jgi:hypothetical protein
MNPSLLTLLKKGATVEFQDGFYLRGLPETKYIEIGFSNCRLLDSQGLWSLSRNGLSDALYDLKQMRKERNKKE